MKILAAVVTYNRLSLLKRCIFHLNNQSYKPSSIIVVDNHSTDGTYNYLKNNQILHIRSKTNTGSAGGWNFCLNYAIAHKFDFVWLMDDDGYPDKNSLFNLVKNFKDDISCLSSIVIDENSYLNLAIPLPILNKHNNPTVFSLKRKINKLDDINLQNSAIYNFATLFNGALLSVKKIKETGQINKSFFLYGEEVDYYFRLREKGKVLTLTSSLHYHPNIKKEWKLIKIYYYLKNSIYLNYKYMDKPLIRSIGNIIIIYYRIIRFNKIESIIDLHRFKNFKTIIIAIIRGFQGCIGNDFQK